MTSRSMSKEEGVKARGVGAKVKKIAPRGDKMWEMNIIHSFYSRFVTTRASELHRRVFQPFQTNILSL